MGPMNERFELRLDTETLERIDGWRARQDDLPTRAEAIRRLVDQGLRQSGDRNELTLDKPQMLMTWLLAEILKHQKGHDQETVEMIQQAIYGGHLWSLDWRLTGVLHDHRDSPAAVREVSDILMTWEAIEDAMATFDQATKDRIADETGPWGQDPQFRGFDGNNETEHLGIADHLVNKMGRFAQFKGRSMNSHMPTLARYRSMARLYVTMQQGMMGRPGLGANDVIALLKRS